MEKIKNMSHLREQKALLMVRQLQAEKNIRIHWNELKESLHPGHLAAEAFDKLTHPSEKETGEKNILQSTLSHGLSLLAQKLATLADEKIKQAFNK